MVLLNLKISWQLLANRRKMIGKKRFVDRITKKFRAPVEVTRAVEKGRSEAIWLLWAHKMTFEEHVDDIRRTQHSPMINSTRHEKKFHHCGRTVYFKSECFHNPESAS